MTGRVRALAMGTVAAAALCATLCCRGTEDDTPETRPEAEPVRFIGERRTKLRCLDALPGFLLAPEHVLEGSEENALHLEFRDIPNSFVLEARRQLRAGGSCVVPLAGFLESRDRVAREVARRAKRGTIEPSFGCDRIPRREAERPRRPDLLLYWIVRYTPAELEGIEGPSVLRMLGKNLAEFSEAVARAEPAPRIELPQAADPLVGTSATDPQNQDCGTQWYLHELGLPKLWAEWNGFWPSAGKAPVLAVVDGGFRKHPELENVLEMDQAWNSCEESKSLNEASAGAFHGTAVVGLLSSQPNRMGMVGVAPGLKIRPIQAICTNGVPGDAWGKAVVWAHENGADVILLEGAAGDRDLEQADMNVEKAVRDAVAAGVVVVLPAGNRGTDSSETPSARNPDTGSIVVGATTFGTRDLAPNSNFGKRVVVSAPGDIEYDLTLGHKSGEPGHIRRFGGTSGAAAKVAGVVALMLATNDKLAPKAVREILGCDRQRALSRDGKPSGRYLDAHMAVKEAMRRRGGS